MDSTTTSDDFTSNSLLITAKSPKSPSHDDQEDSSSWGEQLRRLVGGFGELCYFKLLPHQQQAFVVFASCPEAASALQGLKGEYDVDYGEYSGLQMLQNSALSLHVPPQQRAFLLSPPPSPPEGWHPIHEDINRIPYVDLTPKGNTLLSGVAAHPSIVVQPSSPNPDGVAEDASETKKTKAPTAP